MSENEQKMDELLQRGVDIPMHKKMSHLTEEVLELVQAFNKEHVDNFLEEMIDVELVIRDIQYKFTNGNYTAGEVDDMRTKKLAKWERKLIQKGL